MPTYDLDEFTHRRRPPKRKANTSAFLILFSGIVFIVLIIMLFVVIGLRSQNSSLMDEKNKNVRQIEKYKNDYDKNQQKVDELQKDNDEFKKRNEELEKKREVIQKANAEKVDVTYSKEKTVYLTFDDGPSENTLRVLEILKRYNIKGTFFVTNQGEANKYMKKIVEEGHQIALHTYSHDYAKIYVSTDAFFDDLKKISDIVKDQTGLDVKIARFPGGTSNTVSRRYCQGIMTELKKMTEEKGYRYFDWNVDSEDASGNNIAVSRIIKGATEGIYSSSNTLVVLMHDTMAKNTTIEALPQIIEAYIKIGVKFDVITEDTPLIQFKTLN